METRALERMLVLALLAGLGSVSAQAAESGGILHALDDLTLFRLLAALLGLVSLPLVVGFLMGLAAAEFSRIAWKASQGVWKATVSFGSVAAQYGAMAAVLACVLYFW